MFDALPPPAIIEPAPPGYGRTDSGLLIPHKSFGVIPAITPGLFGMAAGGGNFGDTFEALPDPGPYASAAGAKIVGPAPWGNTNTATFASAAFVPPANSRTVIFVFTYHATTAPGLPTVADSIGGTYTLTDTKTNVSGANGYRVSAFRRDQANGASPASRIYTVTNSLNAAGEPSAVMAYNLAEGFDVVGSITGSASGSATPFELGNVNPAGLAYTSALTVTLNQGNFGTTPTPAAGLSEFLSYNVFSSNIGYVSLFIGGMVDTSVTNAIAAMGGNGIGVALPRQPLQASQKYQTGGTSIIALRVYVRGPRRAKSAPAPTIQKTADAGFAAFASGVYPNGLLWNAVPLLKPNADDRMLAVTHGTGLVSGRALYYVDVSFDGGTTWLPMMWWGTFSNVGTANGWALLRVPKGATQCNIRMNWNANGATTIVAVMAFIITGLSVLNAYADQAIGAQGAANALTAPVPAMTIPAKGMGLYMGMRQVANVASFAVPTIDQGATVLSRRAAASSGVAQETDVFAAWKSNPAGTDLAQPLTTWTSAAGNGAFMNASAISLV